MMEIKTTEEIFNDRNNEWSFKDEECQKHYRKQWVSVNSLKKLLETLEKIYVKENFNSEWIKGSTDIINAIRKRLNP